MNAQPTPSEAHDRLLAEHAELKLLLGEIDKALETRSVTVDEVGQLLGRLGDRLVKHFALEESGGYFAEALLHAPQLLAKANALLAQHPKMCNRAGEIVTEIGSTRSSGGDWWQQTRTKFAAFRDELLRHERSENVLLQEAYTQDLGAHD